MSKYSKCNIHYNLGKKIQKHKKKDKIMKM